MSQAKTLDKASGILFFSGFMLSKLQYLPFPLIAAITRFLSLGLYFAGYGSWLAASYLQPEHKKDEGKWYGFAKLKEQFIFSSALGFIGTALSVAAVFIPALFPLAAALYFFGNVVWTIGEYHKLKNPPDHDLEYSATRQKAYLSYAITTTAISLITFAAATLMVIFPLATMAITISSLLVCVGLGALAFEYWLNSSFGDHKPLKNGGSYQQMNRLNDLEEQPQNDFDPQPQQTKSLFVTPASPKPASESTEIEMIELSQPLLSEDSYPALN